MNARVLRWVAVVSVAVLAAAACSKSTTSAAPTSPGTTTQASSPPPSSPPTPVAINFRLSFIPGADTIPWVAALKEGFFEEAGLQVKIQPASDPSSAIKIVASGASQMGYTYAPDMLFAIDQGLPVTSVYSYMQTADFGLISKKSAGITTPADLAGKRVGVTSIPIDQVSLDTLLASAGLDRNSVDVVDVGFNGEHQVLADRVDATSGLTWSEGVHFQQQGIPFNFLFYRDYGVPDYPFEVIIANNDFLAQNPDAVRAFLAATSRGIQFGLDNPDQAVDDLIAQFPDLDRSQMLFEWTNGVSKQFQSPVTDQNGLGYQDPSQWEGVAKFLEDKGLVKSIDLSTVFTNDYVPST
jgi:ABC-type nitrate/sulfonate/bicarbonate transport system substrate-binding protein